jgi:hypothetical protein
LQDNNNRRLRCGQADSILQGLFGVRKTELEEGDLVFLTTPGRNDILTLPPAGGTYGFPGGCAIEMERERQENRPGVHGGVGHFGYMLPSREVAWLSPAPLSATAESR